MPSGWKKNSGGGRSSNERRGGGSKKASSGGGPRRTGAARATWQARPEDYADAVLADSGDDEGGGGAELVVEAQYVGDGRWYPATVDRVGSSSCVVSFPGYDLPGQSHLVRRDQVRQAALPPSMQDKKQAKAAAAAALESAATAARKAQRRKAY